jgi:diguanylate cyclase (GGDEF)-like protein
MRRSDSGSAILRAVFLAAAFACAFLGGIGGAVAAQQTPVPRPAPRPGSPLIIEVPQSPAAPAAEAASPSTEQAPPVEPPVVAAPPLPAPAPPPRPEGPIVDLSAPATVIDSSPALVPSRTEEAAQSGVLWFTLGVENTSPAPIARVLTVMESPRAGFSGTPFNTRSALRGVAASDASVPIEQAVAFGRNAFRIVLPPNHYATLALQFEGVSGRPVLLAWNEAALIAHNRRVAVLTGLVSGMFTGALAFAAGAAIFTRRPFAKWAAFFIAALLLSHLAASGFFDYGWLTAFGGPYALFSLALALALASGVRLIDHVASYEAFRPWARLWADRIAILIVVLGLASFFGVPWIGLSLRVLAVVACAAAAGYLAHCGRLGVAAARRLAPAATIFALVMAIVALRAAGVFGNNLVAPQAIAGFTAAGALLVALAAAVATSEPTVARLRALRDAHQEDDIQAESTDEAVESREHAAVAASHQGVFDLELASGILAVSAEAASILGLPPGVQELTHDAWLDRIHPDDRNVYIQAMANYRKQPDLAFRIEFRARGPGGRVEWYELRASMTGEGAEAERCLGLIADVTARKAADSASVPARNDALTGLGNRMALFERLESLKGQFHQVALIVLDLDRFKSVNTSLGPDAGDAMLKAAAERLAKKFDRSSIYRVGGDTFALIARRGADLQAMGQTVLQTMAPPFSFLSREVFLPTSIGVAAGDGVREAQDLITQAELAMVQAKRAGGARVCLYSPALAALSGGDAVALDTDLRRALERGEIAVHYQPIVHLADNKVAGFEALLRWAHPQRGMVQPEEFVPYAERSNLIVPLGLFAVRQAVKDLAEWQRLVPSEQPLFVSVNVTWRQLADQKFLKDLEGLVRRSGLPDRTLCLEVTESAVLADAQAAQVTLAGLRKLGVSLAIDDFGTGHSSLSHLQRFPIDAVKIDKSFVPKDAKNGAAILASMVVLAHELELEVVAEGVETAEHAQRLRQLKCDYGQGFFFAPPMPAGEVEQFLRRGSGAAGAGR